LIKLGEVNDLLNLGHSEDRRSNLFFFNGLKDFFWTGEVINTTFPPVRKDGFMETSTAILCVTEVAIKVIS